MCFIHVEVTVLLKAECLSTATVETVIAYPGRCAFINYSWKVILEVSKGEWYSF